MTNSGKKSLAKWIREEHEEVQRRADSLQERLAMPPRIVTSQWLSQTRERFDRFSHHLSRHMMLEEEEGYMEAVVERRPTFSRRVDRLKQEHRDINMLLGELDQSLKTISPENLLLVRDFCLRVRSLISFVEHHEHDENDLVEFAFTEDIGTKD